MRAVAFYLSLPVIYAISLLPFWWLYRLSDVLAFVVMRVFRYRQKVVISNLHRAFPEKNEDELNLIRGKFYRSLCDLALETIKLMTITRAAIRKRVTFENLGLFEGYFSQQRNLLVLMGHCGNWEYSGARMALESLHQLHVAYHPLRNPLYERLLYKMRTRFGNRLFPMWEAMRALPASGDHPSATVLISDQAPARDKLIRTTFLHQNTAFFSGPGRIAVIAGQPVIYAGVRRIRRGHYTIRFTLLTEEPAAHTAEEITTMYARVLEQDIRSAPESWLWTHKRWKHND